MTSRVFVYGTLRPGGSAYLRCLAPYPVSHRPATLADHALYGRGLPYPAIVPRRGHRVRGELVEIDPARPDDALEAMDTWEGDGYRRIEVTVTTEQGSLRAWAYLAADPDVLPDDTLIPSGDWFEHRGPELAF